MDRFAIMHRFANKEFGKYGTLKGGNVSCDTRDYYSYSTVFGQWVDMEKNVCLIYTGNTSVSSSKHQLNAGYFPEDVHVFPYSTKERYYYSGCDLLGYRGVFDLKHRYYLIDQWVDNMYEQFLAIVNDGKKKGLEQVSFEDWEYVEELCSIYKDTSVNKWLKQAKATTDTDKKIKRMVKLLKNGERDVETITDALFGKGTFKKYWDYCAKYRKAAQSREHVERLAHYLKMRSPYRGDWSNELVHNTLSASELRSLTAKERLTIKFANLERLAEKKDEEKRIEKELQNRSNAYKYIVGSEPVLESTWSKSFRDLQTVRNRYTGEMYNLELTHYHSDYAFWCECDLNFSKEEYNSFRTSSDKEQWIRNFYEKCKQISYNIKAQNLLIAIEAHKKPHRKYSWRKEWVDDEYLSEKLTGEELAICKDYIRRQDEHMEREAAEERAMEIRRKREEEERKKEEELQKKIKEEEIQKCLNGTDDDKRNLWRLHYMDIDKAESSSQIPNFYNGGNVLMRFNMDKSIVETSMNIRLDIETCKKFFRLISIWHQNPSKFKPIRIDTHYSGSYTISSYENDILTAGCHKIAYAEMERMYNSILENEKKVV